MLSLCFPPSNSLSLRDRWFSVWNLITHRQASQRMCQLLFFSLDSPISLSSEPSATEILDTVAFVSHPWQDRTPPSSWKGFFPHNSSHFSYMKWQNKCHCIDFEQQVCFMLQHLLFSSNVLFYIPIKHGLTKGLSQGRWTVRSVWLFYT